MSSSNQTAVVGTIPTIYYDQVDDLPTRQSLKNINDYFSSQNQWYGFDFLELVFTAAVTNQLVSHNLGIIPQDVSVTRITGTGSVTFNIGLFTSTNINVSTTGPCRVRFFIGTYWNYLSAAASNNTDTQSYSAASSSSSASASSSSVVQVTTPLTQTQVQSGSFAGSTMTNYLVRSGDGIIYTSGTNAITLPLASSIPNQKITIYKTDATFSITTITCSALDLIAGASTTTLNTYQERIEIISNGTAWVILTRDYFKGATTYTPTTSTPTNSTCTGVWYRQGNKIIIDAKITYVGGTDAGVTITLSLPSPLVVDSAKLVYTTNVLVNIVGKGIAVSSTGIAYDASMYMLNTDTNKIKFGGLQAIAAFTGTQYPNDNDFTSAIPVAIANTSSLIMNVAVPISGWKG